MSALLIIDYANTVLRSLSVHSQLEWEGQITGGLYGFVTQLASQINKYHPSHILVCKDSPPYLRSTLYPEYKADRKTTKKPDWYPAVRPTFDMVDKFLEQLHCTPWSIPGFEADDLIAAVIKQQHFEYDKILVLSNDDDLFQLLNYSKVLLLKKAGNMNYVSFKKEYPMLEPQDWIQITAMTGTHNAVKGIERCGLKTAIKWFEYQCNTGFVHQKVTDHKELIERNKKLIQLPLQLEGHPITVVPPQAPIIKTRDVMRFLSQYGISYTSTMDTAFGYYGKSQLHTGFDL